PEGSRRRHERGREGDHRVRSRRALGPDPLAVPMSRSGVRHSTLVVAMILSVCAGRVWALGSVRANVSGDKLTITGDDAPNAVQVIPGVGPDAFVVVGLEATVVNGALSATFSGVKKLSIDVKGGADRVELTDVVLDGTLFMQGGRVSKKAEIKGGKDGDDIRVR